MEKDSNILQELQMISPALAELLKNSPHPSFFIPGGYFETVEKGVMQRIRGWDAETASAETQNLSPLLAGLKKKMPFSTPDNFFEKLSGSVVEGIKAVDFVQAELESLSPVMIEAKNANAFTVPDGYFNGLAENVLQKVKAQNSEKLQVVTRESLKTQENRGSLIRMFSSKVSRFAVAASLIVVAALGAWIFFEKDITPSTTSNGDLADLKKLSDKDIVNYIDNNGISLADGTTSVNTEATTSNTEESSSSDLTPYSNADISADDMDEILSEVSDDDLEKYVTKNGL